ALALRQDGTAALKMPDAQLGALKIEQDRRRPPELLLQRTDMLDQLRLLLLVTMAHVDPKRVSTGQHQLADGPCVARCGAQCREDLHLAGSWGEDCFGHVVSGRWDAMP